MLNQCQDIGSICIWLDFGHDFDDFSLFAVVKLIDDSRGTAINHQVVEYWDYPHYPEQNDVVLSTSPARIQSQVTQIGQQIENPNSSYNQQQANAVANATNWITGADGGYVVFQRNAQGQPYEILIMDQPTIETATKVWRWNSGGLGYSSNGYNGPYTTAITQDGAIVADFITTGTLTANLIKAGVLSSLNGAASLDLTSGNAVFNGGLACETLSVKGYDETDPVLATLKVLNYSGLNVPYFAIQDEEGVACLNVSQSVSGDSPPQLTSTALAIGRSANVGTEGNIYFSASLTDVISNMAMYGAKNKANRRKRPDVHRFGAIRR